MNMAAGAAVGLLPTARYCASQSSGARGAGNGSARVLTGAACPEGRGVSWARGRWIAVALLWLVLVPSRGHADHARDPLPPGQTKFRVFAGADGLRNLVVGAIAQ